MEFVDQKQWISIQVLSNFSYHNDQRAAFVCPLGRLHHAKRSEAELAQWSDFDKLYWEQMFQWSQDGYEGLHTDRYCPLRRPP